MLLVSLVGWVCSSRAQKEAKKAAATLSVYSFGAPCSASLKSWLVVARSASARLQLVGHLGWVHRQEARAVGRPRERMMPLRSAQGAVRISYIICEGAAELATGVAQARDARAMRPRPPPREAKGG